MDELCEMLDSSYFPSEDLRLMFEGGVDEDYVRSLSGQHVMFVHQTVDQMRLLDRYLSLCIQLVHAFTLHFFSTYIQ